MPNHSPYDKGIMTTKTSVYVVAATTTAASVLAASLYYRHLRALAQIAQNEATIAKLEETRSAERKGRIRAEMKLRSHMKEHEAKLIDANIGSSLEAENLNNFQEDDVSKSRNNYVGKKVQPQQQNHSLLMHCIGTIVSPYTKRMGTPRQGALVPSGRGFIQLRIPVECIEGLELYSHAWVLFTFHANTDTPSANGAASNSFNKLNLSKTKIRPPRGNGIKVGMLATRSPHRPNNVGLSLVKIVRVDKKEKRLHLAALDLVNGTPVYDVKPCVPWDIPGHHDKVPLAVPTWVSQDDALQTVEFTTIARESLAKQVKDGKLAPLYTTKNGGTEGAIETIREVLAQDPRASNSNGPNKRGSKIIMTSSGAEADERSDSYKFLFCDVQVEFLVSNNGVEVLNVKKIDFDSDQYVDGIPVLLSGS
mmetsp:Transcript_21708/g.43524  ORF Transcript_21708/g.43524 Transcript_21708/m.43524 type:complete len:421 (-) Transcript_21708:88-1350(-)